MCKLLLLAVFSLMLMPIQAKAATITIEDGTEICTPKKGCKMLLNILPTPISSKNQETMQSDVGRRSGKPGQSVLRAGTPPEKGMQNVYEPKFGPMVDGKGAAHYTQSGLPRTNPNKI